MTVFGRLSLGGVWYRGRWKRLLRRLLCLRLASSHRHEMGMRSCGGLWTVMQRWRRVMGGCTVVGDSKGREGLGRAIEGCGWSAHQGQHSAHNIATCQLEFRSRNRLLRRHALQQLDHVKSCEQQYGTPPPPAHLIPHQWTSRTGVPQHAPQHVYPSWAALGVPGLPNAKWGEIWAQGQGVVSRSVETLRRHASAVDSLQARLHKTRPSALNGKQPANPLHCYGSPSHPLW